MSSACRALPKLAYRQPDDHQEDQRHDDPQALHGPLLILELAAVRHVVALRRDCTLPATSRCTSAANPPRSRPRTLLCTITIRSPFSWLISSGPSTTRTRATWDNGTPPPGRRVEQQLPDRLRRAAIGFGEAHDDGESLPAVDDLARLRATDALPGPHRARPTDAGRSGPGAGRSISTSTCMAPALTSTETSSAPAYLGDDVADLARLALQHREIVAEHLDAQLGADAGDGLVEAHGHGRGEVVVDARDLCRAPCPSRRSGRRPTAPSTRCGA